MDAGSADASESLKLLEKAVALNEGAPAVHFELGTVLDRLQRYGDAARAYERAATLDPADAPTQYRLARDYDRLGRTADAQRARDRHEKLTRAQDEKR